MADDGDPITVSIENLDTTFMEKGSSFNPEIVGNIRMDFSVALSAGNIGEVVDGYIKRLGKNVVKDEIVGMSYKDMADVALAAADAMGDQDLARQMANLVRNHQGYDRARIQIQALLEKYPK